MKRIWKFISEGDLLLVISTCLFVIFVLFPISVGIFIIEIVNYPFERKKRKEFQKELNQFLTENDNKNFFIYNNKEILLDLIQKEIIPKLDEGIDVVFIEGRKINERYKSKYMSHLMYNFKNYKKFPHLMKIRNCKVEDKSLNDNSYNIINKDVDEVLKEVNSFFGKKF